MIRYPMVARHLVLRTTSIRSMNRHFDDLISLVLIDIVDILLQHYATNSSSSSGEVRTYIC